MARLDISGCLAIALAAYPDAEMYPAPQSQPASRSAREINLNKMLQLSASHSQRSARQWKERGRLGYPQVKARRALRSAFEAGLEL